ARLKAGFDFPEPYCSPRFYQGVEPITSVTFRSINNRTSGSLYTEPPLENFTTISTSVAPGDYLPLRVEGVVVGQFGAAITAFFDWDQNGSLEAGERVQIGQISTSNGNDGVHATAAV